MSCGLWKSAEIWTRPSPDVWQAATAILHTRKTCCNFFTVSTAVFFGKCDGERISEISRYLMKVWQKLCGILFWLTMYVVFGLVASVVRYMYYSRHRIVLFGERYNVCISVQQLSVFLFSNVSIWFIYAFRYMSILCVYTDVCVCLLLIKCICNR